MILNQQRILTNLQNLNKEIKSRIKKSIKSQVTMQQNIRFARENDNYLHGETEIGFYERPL